ncbi:MAG: hypothetical protein UR93_C0019G0002 [Berkelbacteria bacterium GW2011_GWA2_35_9]|uniref:Uncharacterized protein n=1 Tax=Berkelbacteria bacterium GW2011_GWA2_35_9 TaxID=1618333 RepID=A0A0G0G929_9BACT|nr:MAG: hypothetical protein UR93_C0019G0002 [Berkelbacteria bacterium GW2011_GWA2_35_9]
MKNIRKHILDIPELDVKKYLHQKIMFKIDNYKKIKKYIMWLLSLLVGVLIINWVYMFNEQYFAISEPVVRILHAENILLKLVLVSPVWLILVAVSSLAIIRIIASVTQKRIYTGSPLAPALVAFLVLVTIEFGSIAGCASALMLNAGINITSVNNTHNYIQELRDTSLAHLQEK